MKHNNLSPHTHHTPLWHLRRLLLLVALLAASGSLHAQHFSQRGISLGADRDTLLFIIASPFDNWYLNVGGGIQTFIGNEIVASARRNSIDYSLKAEIGKWIIPDVAISARLSYFSVHGQSEYGRQPFIDKINDQPNANGYYPFSAQALSLIGYVTLDWTNFFLGYEVGRRTHTHIFTPVGLGMSMLFGQVRNPRHERYGGMARNFELAYSAGIGAEYEVSPELAINANLEIFGSESTWDWSPYDNSYSIFDIMPNFSVGAKFNLLKHVHKRDIHTDQVYVDSAYHYFRSFGSRNTVPMLTGRIETLERQIDSTLNLADKLMHDDSLRRADLAAAILAVDSLQNQLDSIPIQPTNVMQALSQANEELGLPATVIYFQLDKYTLDFNARKRLQRFAKEMQRSSDTLEYLVIGAADSLTGTRRHNDWLSERRCEAARDALSKDYGANANQLILVPVGGITAYDPIEDNRMAMIILRTPETEAIIKQWTRYKKR